MSDSYNALRTTDHETHHESRNHLHRQRADQRARTSTPTANGSACAWPRSASPSAGTPPSPTISTTTSTPSALPSQRAAAGHRHRRPRPDARRSDARGRWPRPPASNWCCTSRPSRTSRSMFARRNRPMPERNRVQAIFPAAPSRSPIRSARRPASGCKHRPKRQSSVGHARRASRDVRHVSRSR